MTDTQSKIRDLGTYEQNLVNLSQQRQQFHSQLFEIESALKELKKSKTSYKIIGNVMIKVEAEDLTKDLLEKEEIIKLRLSTIEKQEKSIGEKAASLQKEIMEEMRKEKENAK